MEDQKEILHELENELQEMNIKKESLQSEQPLITVEDHHSKKHIGIIIALTILLVAILVIIALVFRPSQEPEDVLKRLEAVSAPVTQTPEEVAQELDMLSENRSTPAWDTLPPDERDQKMKDAQAEIEQLGNL